MTASEPHWNDVAKYFVPDGALRDIFVLGTTREDWKRVLESLRTSPFTLRFQLEGAPVPAPDLIDELLQDTDESCRADFLAVTRGAIQFNGHFDCNDEIEFDADPREINDENAWQIVLDFMLLLARATGKRAAMIEEGNTLDYNWPLLIVHPDGRVQLFEHDPPTDDGDWVPLR